MNANDDIDTNIKIHDTIYFQYNIHLSVIWFIRMQLYFAREQPTFFFGGWLLFVAVEIVPHFFAM